RRPAPGDRPARRPARRPASGRGHARPGRRPGQPGAGRRAPGQGGGAALLRRAVRDGNRQPDGTFRAQRAPGLAEGQDVPPGRVAGWRRRLSTGGRRAAAVAAGQTMDAERWRRLSPLLDALLELDPQVRLASLASMRGEDPHLADELAALLALEEDADGFLDTPLVAPLPGARPGSQVGPYRLERLLGEGGMGQVWLASRADGLYQRRVALKLLRPGLADPGLRLRFTREREILARLEHAHIARLLDAGISADHQPYLALDYVDGEPISDWCGRRGLEVRPLVRLFLQVCDAVSHAHANLIVHRDLKPSNIL